METIKSGQNITDKIKKSIGIKIVLLIFALLGVIYIEMPGLYFDAANPDYTGLHVLHSDNVPEWAFSDNVIASIIEGSKEYSHFPVLNSLYGTCFEAYAAMAWAILFGYGVTAVRSLHILYALILLMGIYSLLKYILGSNDKAAMGTVLLALEPSLIFSTRTQYYIQLFPYVFFSFGILLLLKTLMGEKSQWTGIVGTILLGLSASSYFVFAVYFTAIFMVYIFISMMRNKNRITAKNGMRLAGGFLIGYIPYLYGHISIILTQGINGWINAVKGLDTYGISDGAKATMAERIKHIVEIIGTIGGGQSIIKQITGIDIGYGYPKLISSVYILAVMISLVLLVKKRKKLCESKRLVLLLMFDNSFLLHVILGLIVGTSLGYQHFVMLLPIMYVTIVVTAMELGDELLANFHLSNNMINLCQLCLVLVIMTTSAVKVGNGYYVIVKTGGIGYYSEAINDLSYFLNGVVTNDDIIISPQWGYWIPIACITNGEKQIWINTDSDTLQWQLDNTQKQGNFYIVIDDRTDADMINGLMKANGYDIDCQIRFADYGDILKPAIYIYKR